MGNTPEFKIDDYIKDETDSVLWKVKRTWRNMGDDLIVVLYRDNRGARYVASSWESFKRLRHATDAEVLAARLTQ
jgi:hypothetical protein